MAPVRSGARRRTVLAARPAALLARLVPLAVLCLWLVQVPRTALGQARAPRVNLQTLRPGAAAADGLFARSAETRDGVSWLASLCGARRLLAIRSEIAGDVLEQEVVGRLWMLDLGLAWQGAGWTVEAAAPVALGLQSGGPNLARVVSPRGPAMGDLRVAARRLLKAERGGPLPYTLRAGLGWAVPTAADNSWLGGDGAELDAFVLATARLPAALIGTLDTGLRTRRRQSLAVPQVDPVTGAPLTDSAGEPIASTILATGGLWRIAGKLERRWLGGRLGTALEGQVLLNLRSDGVAAGPIADGLISVDGQLSPGISLFGALGGAVGASAGAARVRGIAGVRIRPADLPADRDGDGVQDRVDACPGLAEDLDGHDDADGCPDLDDDLDRVPDAVDRCRLVPEDADGFEDEDGCPDPDNDGDGIPDVRDRCPDEAEDIDRFEDTDGCPDPDNDRDGLADADDLCPLTPENRNRFEDDDGCPDVAPPADVAIEDEVIVLARPVRFVFGSAQLAPAGRKALDLIAGVLRRQRDIRKLAVGVYTDDNGTPEALLALSQARAASIVRYLADVRAIERTRLDATGHGAANPLQPNTTLAGRSANRRVEFRIVTRGPPPSPAAPQP